MRGGPFRNSNEFSPVGQRIYLDHAATTPTLPAVREAVAEGMARWANPSSTHAPGRAARAALEDARQRIAAAYGWTGEVILTSGASEAMTLALDRAVAGRRFASAVEHEAAFRGAEPVTRLPVDGSGVIDLGALDVSVEYDDPPALVAVQWCNSETGVVQPIQRVGLRLAAVDALLLVDATQMPPGWDSAVAKHADFVAVSAHKRGGPPGVGALLVRDLARLQPTGGQERGYRGGTENLPGAMGFAAALEEPEDLDRLEALRAWLDAEIVGAGGYRVPPDAFTNPAIGAYRMPGVPASVQLIKLDMAGISVSAGSACSSGSMRPSHVLSAMGTNPAAAGELVRVSFGRHTSMAELERFAAIWRTIAAEARNRAA